jgi:D-alanyl-D-alanine carboxypeptidase
MNYFHKQAVHPQLLLVLLFTVFWASKVDAADALRSNATPSAIDLAKLDGYALALTEAELFSGVVLIAQDGNVLFEKAYGLRDENTEDANTTDTRFNLASAGKMFTAVAVLQLVAQKKLNLDSTVGEVLRDYPNRDFAQQVTVRQLLTHSAGAGDIALFDVENAENRKRVKTVSDMLALHSQRAPEFSPGSQQKYGNFGHVVLGRMVEVLSGESYENYLQQHIFKLAGMSQTSFTPCLTYAKDIAVSYLSIDGKRVRNCATQPVRGFPAGGQISSASDMHRFVRALLDGKLLPTDIFAEATRPHREFMGLGFFATGYGEGWHARDFRWGHGGNADGVCTDVRTYPKTGETLIVLSNREAPACFSIANMLHNQWLRKNTPTKDTP